MAEPGIKQTDIMKLNKPEKGFFDWDTPLNENWDKLDLLGAGQLPLLCPLETRHKLEGAELLGWTIQGGVLDGEVATSVWDKVYAAKQRAGTQVSKQIRGVTYYYSQDSVTGMVFVTQTEYQKALDNLGDSLGYVCTFENNKKYIQLPADRSFNLPILESDGVPGEFVDETLPNIIGQFVSRSGLENAAISALTNGAFSATKKANGQYFGPSTDNDSIYTFNFDAHKSNETFQTGALVKPRSHKVYRYYKTGNTIANKDQIDLGALTEQVANLGTDIANLKTINLSNSDILVAVPNWDSKFATAGGAIFYLEQTSYIYVLSSTAPGTSVTIHAGKPNAFTLALDNGTSIYDYGSETYSFLFEKGESLKFNGPLASIFVVPCKPITK